MSVYLVMQLQITSYSKLTNTVYGAAYPDATLEVGQDSGDSVSRCQSHRTLRSLAAYHQRTLFSAIEYQ
jgi:hypothetical protein